LRPVIILVVKISSIDWPREVPVPASKIVALIKAQNLWKPILNSTMSD
jgi:hypothetical protein